jgi:hypothetical protein
MGGSVRAGLLLCAILLGVAPATAGGRDVPFTNVGNWEVHASYNDAQVFLYCSAGTSYRDNTWFTINENAKGAWILVVMNGNWPSDRTGTIPVTLMVDQQVVARTQATWLRNGAGITFDNVDEVVALMRGRGLQIVTPIGTSGFQLEGSYKAALAVSECWKFHNGGAGQQAGAFGPSRSSGAFGTSTSGSNVKAPQVYSRADTMEVAALYLGKAGLPYTILPENENEFKNLPVNWKYGDHSIGGIMVMGGQNLSGENILVSLLQDQAKSCSEKSGVSRLPVRREASANYYDAKGICQVGNSTASMFYSVAEGSDFVVVVVEMVDEADATAHPSWKEQPQGVDGGLLSNFSQR